MSKRMDLFAHKIVADHQNSQLYKELESINFEIFSKIQKASKPKKITSFFRAKSKGFTKSSQREDQLDLFQQSLKVLLTLGQFLGLNPVTGILKHDVSKISFKCRSCKFIYSCFILLCQTAATVFSIYRILKKSVSTSITYLSFVSFFSATTMITFLFLRVASKWPALMKNIYNSNLDKYMDKTVRSKCFKSSLLFLFLALLEHLLSINSKLCQILTCPPANDTLYEDFIALSFPWYTELELPFYIPMGIILQVLNIITTLTWSYSEMFLVCISFYLVSLLEQINKAVVEAEQKCYPPYFWAYLREDYTRAIRLVGCFDDVISGVMLTSFASNLFFICLQLFNILAHGLRAKLPKSTPCSYTDGPFGGYEDVVYFIFSFTFVLGRFLAVALIGASVHTASVASAQSLYNVPSTVYCSEIQRFLEQVNSNTVALTGLQFFDVTRGLILSVAGTIVTYELVLLQFSDED